jgi:hypothetical protein
VSNFVEAVVENDALTLEQEVIELLEARFGTWEPAEAALSTWIIKAFTRIASTTREQAAAISKEAFKRFGETLVNVPPIQASAATVASTWTMIDDAGYTIPEGTLVTIAASGEEVFAFRTVEAVTVPAGATATAPGAVMLRCVEPGQDGNGLIADPQLSDNLAFIASIALAGVSAGGEDAESEDAYLDRLKERLQLLSLSLIVPRDFEIDARSHPGIARALCLPAYNAETETANVPLCYTVVPLDLAGHAPSALTREELRLSQAAKVPSGVDNFVGLPTHTAIDLLAEVVVAAGFDPAAVLAAVELRLAAYLDPANWGLPVGYGDPGNSSGWVNTDTVYRNELIAEVSNVGGVDRVVTLKLAKAGAELKASESIALPGIAPLTEPGSIEVSAV